MLERGQRDAGAREQRRVVGVEEPAHREQHAGAAAREDVRRLGAPEPRVDRDEHAARGRHAERGDDPLERVRRPHRDPVAALDARREERARGVVDHRRERGEVDAPGAVDHGLGVAEAVRGVPDHRGDRRPRDLAAHPGIPPLRSAKTRLTEFESALAVIGYRLIIEPTAGNRPMRAHDHEYHPLTVVDVVDETRRHAVVRPRHPARARARRSPTPPGSSARSGRRSTASRSCAATRCRARPTPATRFTTAVKRVPGGRMSNWMNDTLAPGDTIEVMRPTGLFVLHERPTCRSSRSPAAVASRP